MAGGEIRVVFGDARIAAMHERAFDGLVARAAGADELDDLVDVADGVDEALADVRLLLRVAEQVTRAAADDVLAVIDEVGRSAPSARACAAGG